MKPIFNSIVSIYCIYFSVCCSLAQAAPQTEQLNPKNLTKSGRFSIEATGGVISGGFRDEMYSPFNYDNVGFSSGLTLGYGFKKSIIELNLGYGQSRLTTPLSKNFESDYYGVTISASYLHPVWQPSKKLTLLVGGGYSFRLDGVIKDMGNYTYIASHSFEPVVRFDYHLHKRHSFSTRFSLYLLGFVSRPSYNRIPEYDDNEIVIVDYILKEISVSNFAFIGQYLDFNLNVDYTFHLSRVIDLGLRYRFRVQKFNEIQPLSQFNNSFMLTAKVTL